jgi:hypothetical protein
MTPPRKRVPKMKIEDLEKYAKDAPKPLTRFQIEKFIIALKPPTERYFTCCQEIKSRIPFMKDNNSSLEKKKMIEGEIEIFAELAEIWKPLTRGLKYEELQHKIWDERLSYQICISLMSGSSCSSFIKEVLAMPDGSVCKELLGCVYTEGCEFPNEMIKKFISEYNSARPLIDDQPVVVPSEN